MTEYLKRFHADRKTIFSILVLVLAFLVTGYAIYTYYPEGSDWQLYFAPLAQHVRDPYAVKDFVNPPWIYALIPYVFLPERISETINLLITFVILALVVRKAKGGWLGVILTFTCPWFLYMFARNPIDWIPMLGYLLPPTWGFPLMLIKPQTIGASALILWKKAGFKFKVLIPSIAVLILSFILWGNWITPSTTDITSKPWNLAMWPFGIPIGLFLLYLAWKKDDEIIAAAATPFLVPYIAPYSIFCILPMMSGKYKKAAIAFYLFTWWFLVVENRRMGIPLFTLP